MRKALSSDSRVTVVLIWLITTLVVSTFMSGCANQSDASGEPSKETNTTTSTTAMNTTTQPPLVFTVDGTDIAIDWEDNASVDALRASAAQGDITVRLHPYGGFELVGPLPETITSDDQELSAQPGDLLLYQSSNMVLMFGENQWAYTKLGHVNPDSMGIFTELSSATSATATISLRELE